MNGKMGSDYPRASTGMLDRRALMAGALGAAFAPRLDAQAKSYPVLRPETFGAVGDGSTDDTAALNRCFAAVRAAGAKFGGADVRLAGRYAVSATVVLRNFTGNISIRGMNADAGFNAIGPGNPWCLSISGGRTVPNGTAIRRDASHRQHTIAVFDTNLFAAGDYVVIGNDTGYEKDSRRHINRVARVSGDTLELELPLPFDLTAQQRTWVNKVSLTGHVSVDQLMFDGSANRGDARGLSAQYLFAPRISRIRSNSFDRDTSRSQMYQLCYGGSFSQLRDERSGSRRTNGIQFYMISNASIRDAESIGSTGFGVGITFVNSCAIRNVRSIRAALRGVKLYSACSNTLANIAAYESGKTGLGLTSGSSYNSFVNTETLNNGESGHWLNGTGNVGNKFDKVSSRGNGTVDLHVAVTPPLMDLDNVFLNVEPGIGKMAVDPQTRTIVKFND
jgi:hypothetical protein